jgi:SAM-dependent methyltransferase
MVGARRYAAVRSPESGRAGPTPEARRGLLAVSIRTGGTQAENVRQEESMIEQRRPVGGDPMDLALAGLIGSLPAAQRVDRNVAPRVVDVGGGSGTRAVPLAIVGCRVTVVDSSVDALAILHRRAEDAGVADRVAGVQADADLLATVIPPGSADLVLCHHLLEEVDDPAAVVAALSAAVRPGGQVSVLVAGRLGAILGQTLAGRFAEAKQMLTDPDGRYAAADPLRRRYDVAGIGDLLTGAGLRVTSVTGVGVLSGLVSGAARQAVPGGDGELAHLEALAAAHPALREIATDLHVVAVRGDG